MAVSHYLLIPEKAGGVAYLSSLGKAALGHGHTTGASSGCSSVSTSTGGIGRHAIVDELLLAAHVQRRQLVHVETRVRRLAPQDTAPVLDDHLSILVADPSRRQAIRVVRRSVGTLGVRVVVEGEHGSDECAQSKDALDNHAGVAALGSDIGDVGGSTTLGQSHRLLSQNWVVDAVRRRMKCQPATA